MPVRVFKNRWFEKFARKQEIDDGALREAIDRAEAGLVDADLGGGIIKQRVARKGEASRVVIGPSWRFAQVIEPCFCSASRKATAPIFPLRSLLNSAPSAERF